jgi:dipeptidase
MAPDETTITCVPRARAAAISAHSVSSQASRGVASSAFTSSALPIFKTSRRAVVTLGRAVTPARKVNRKNLLFLKKKKQKDFYLFAGARTAICV